MVDADLSGGITPDFFTAVAQGSIPDSISGSRVGTNEVIPSTIFIILSNITSVTRIANLPPAAQQMQVVSSSANDTAAGTGAQQVELTYLTTPATGFQKKTETVTLNGLIPVLTVNTDIYRIDRFKVSRVGATGTSAGNISLQSVGGATTFEQIPALENDHRSAVHWVQKGFKTTVTDLIAGVSTIGGVIFVLIVFEEDSNGNVVGVANQIFEFGQGSFSHRFNTPPVVANLNGLEKGVLIAVKGRASNQAASGSFRFADLPI